MAACLRLDLRGPLEVGHGLLVHLVLDEISAEPADDVHVDGEVAVALLVVVEGLGLVLLLEVDVTDAGEDAGVGGHARVEYLEPLDGGARLVGDVEQVGDLPHDLPGRKGCYVR